MRGESKICSSSGAALSEGAAFCSKCGTPTNRTVAQVPRSERHPGRWLAAGLVLLWLGVFFYLSQTIVMPTQAWYAYFVAGLGVVLVVLGLLRYWQSHPLTRQRLSAEVKGYHEQRPRTKFSGQLGIEHKVLMSKKILFEFDPSTPYQTVVRDFALECVANREHVIVLTPTGSVVHKAVEGDKGISVINLAPDTMLSSVLEEHPERPLNFIYDGLTDLALSTDPRTAYRFAMNSLRQLSDPRIAAIFLLNPSAHELKDVSSFRGLFSNEVVYGKDGLSSVKLE